MRPTFLDFNALVMSVVSKAVWFRTDVTGRPAIGPTNGLLSHGLLPDCVRPMRISKKKR